MRHHRLALLFTLLILWSAPGRTAQLQSAPLQPAPAAAGGRSPLWLGHGAVDEMTGQDSVLVGGRRIGAFPGRTVPDPGAGASLDIVAAPYGPFNAGCALCLFTSQSDIADNRAGISGLDYRMGAGAVRGQDLVGLYEAPTTLQARMILDVDHYDAGTVYLRTPMTGAQMAELQRNMYIITNSTDPRFGLRPLPGYDDNALRLVNLVSGLIDGWSEDGRTIHVSGWAVPSGSDFSAGQVPSVAHLDGYWSQYDHPVVFVGAGTKMFGRNTWMYYDGSRTKGHATSLVRAMETEEVDLRYTASRAHEVEMRGMTISMDPLGGYGPHGLTSDSYHLLLSGYSPTMLMFNDGRDTNVIKAHAFLVRGNEGVARERPAGELFEHSAYADAASNMRLVGYLTRSGGRTGAPAASLHLALRIDGTQGEPTSGGDWGGIVWNRDGANNGGLSLCGGSGACGLSEAWDGSLSLGPVRGDLVVQPSAGAGGGGAIRPAAYRFAVLPRGEVPGAQLFCTDCRSAAPGSAAGIPVWWNGSSWHDALGVPPLH